MSSNVNVSPYFNGGWDGAVSKKTYKNPTKPIKIPWGSFGVSWVFEMVLWCFGGIVVHEVIFFAKKTPNKRVP